MSKSIILTKYSYAGEGKNLAEENSDILVTTAVAENLLNIIESFSKHILILEEGSDEGYEQQIIDNDKIDVLIDSIVNKCEEAFKKYLNNDIPKKEKDTLLNEITALLENRRVLNIKLEKYAADESIYLVIG